MFGNVCRMICIDGSIDGSTDGSMDRSINQSINPSINQSINQSIDRSIDGSINQPTTQSINLHPTISSFFLDPTKDPPRQKMRDVTASRQFLFEKLISSAFFQFVHGCFVSLQRLGESICCSAGQRQVPLH